MDVNATKIRNPDHYFLESEPAQSSPNDTDLYAIPTSPFDYAAFASWGLGLLLLFLGMFKFLRNALPTIDWKKPR